MIAGDHHRTDACAAALGNGCLHLRPHRIDHAGQAHKHQILLQKFRRMIPGLFRPVPLCRRQHPQRPVGHGFVGRQDFRPFFLGHGLDLPVFIIGGTPGQHHIRAALGILDKPLRSGVDGGHHLPSGIEGCLVHPRGFLFQILLFQPQGTGEIHQGALGGFSLRLIVVVEHCVGAQSHGSGQQGGVAHMIHHRHLVLGQGSGFVGADHLGAAQGFHSSQPPDHRIAFGHIGHADGQHHGDHRGQSLRNGRHRQRYRHHEGIQNHLQVEVPGHDQVEYENEHADAQHQLGQHPAQFFQLPLQGRLLLLGLGQGTGDFAHLRIHAGVGDHGFAPAINHGGAHVAHVLPVTQGDVTLLLAEAQGFQHLVHRHRLPGEGGLFYFERGVFDYPPVGRDCVAGFQHNHVPGHQLVGVKCRQFSIPQHLAGGGSHGLKGFNGRFRLTLLEDSQNGVEQHHGEDDDHLGPLRLPGQHAGQAGYACSRQQNDQHGIFQLRHKPLQQGGLFCRGQFVRAVFGQPAGRFPAAQPVRAHAQIPEDFPGGLGINLFHSVLSLLCCSLQPDYTRSVPAPQYHIRQSFSERLPGPHSQSPPESGHPPRFVAAPRTTVPIARKFPPQTA